MTFALFPGFFRTYHFTVLIIAAALPALTNEAVELTFLQGTVSSDVNGLRDTVPLTSIRSTHSKMGGSKAEADYQIENNGEQFIFELTQRLNFHGDDLGISNEANFDFRLDEPVTYELTGSNYWQGNTISGVLGQTFLFKNNPDGSATSLYAETDHSLSTNGTHLVQGYSDGVPLYSGGVFVSGSRTGFLEPGSYRMTYIFSLRDELLKHTNNTDLNGTFKLSLSASAQSGTPSNISEGVEYPITSTSGDKPWFKSLATSHDGIDSARSGAISNGQQSSIELGFSSRSLVSFWWKVSSETNEDFLRLYLDGHEIRAISGDVDWQQRFVLIPESVHKLEWVYAKGLNGTAGEDAGWIDAVRIYDSNSQWPVVSQSIDFPSPKVDGFSANPVQLAATASSGLPVNYSLLRGPALLRGNILVPTGPGLVIVQASQNGDGAYTPAPPVDQSILFGGEVPRVLAANTPQMSVAIGEPNSRKVQAIAIQSDGKIIIGGYFDSVNGVPRSNIARFNKDGTLDINWQPVVNARGVSGLVLHGNDLFISGDFNEVNGVPRNSLAKISLTHGGTLDPIWDPRVGGLVLSMAPVEDGLIVGGIFSQINGRPQHSLAKLSMSGSGLPDPDWMPEPNDNVFGMAVYGNDIYFTGIFTSSKGIPIPPLAKATILGQGGIDLNWNKAFAGAYAQAMLATEKSLFVGGLGGLVEFSALDGKVVSRSYTNRIVTALGRNGGDLYVATSGYLTDDPSNNSRIDKVSLSTFSKDPNWNPYVMAPNPGQFGPISTIALHGADVFAVGDFTSVAGSPGSGIAVLPVLEASPIVTGTTTSRGYESTTGLTIIADPLDFIETTHFKIFNIENGTLFRANGIAQIRDGDFITAAEGAAGLRFQPGSGFVGTGRFAVLGSRSGTEDGVGGAEGTGLITVIEKRLAQTISGGFLDDVPFSVGSVQLKYTASSGLPIRFGVSGPARLEGDMVILTGLGDVIISATQAGNEVFEPSPIHFQSFTVKKGIQSIDFPVIDNAQAKGIVALKAVASSGLPVTYEIVSGPASISGNAVIFGSAGTAIIRAMQPGNELFGAAPATEQTVLVRHVPQTIGFDPPTGIAFKGGYYTLQAAASSGLPTSFAVVSGPAIIQGNQITATGGGVVIISAIQEGNDEYEATHVEKSISVARAQQAITFFQILNAIYPGTNITLEAFSSSGLPITFTVVSGPGEISGEKLKVTKPGLLTVSARQPGNSDYEASAIYTQTLNVLHLGQEIIFEPITNTAFQRQTIELHAAATSALPVSFKVIFGPATVSSNLLTLLGAGSIQVVAEQRGDEMYDPAPSRIQAFFVAKGEQTIKFEPLMNIQAGGTYALNAIASSGLPVEFKLLSGDAVLSSSNLLTAHFPGTVVIAAMQGGDTNFEAAADSLQSVTVAKATQTIQFKAIPDTAWNADPIQLEATASSGLPVSFQIITGSAKFSSTSSNTIILSNASTVRIRAYQDGNDYYAPAQTEQSFHILKTAQAITFAPILNTRFGESIALRAEASSGLAVEFAVTSGPASVHNNFLVVYGLGEIEVWAQQPGNSRYEPVETNQTIVISKGSQTVQFDPPSEVRLKSGPISLPATSSAGLLVRYGILSGPATVDGNLIYPIGLGEVSIIAMQSGNEFYEQATSVERTITIGKAVQTIQFAPPEVVFVRDKSLILQATATTGLPVRLAVLSGPVVLSGNVLTIVGTGTARIQAFQTGDSITEAAPTVERTISIQRSAQTIFFTRLPDQPFGGAPVPLSAATSSGLPVSFQLLSGPGRIENSVLSWTNSGAIVIRLSQAGDLEYDAAPEVTQTINILSAPAPTLNIQLENATIVLRWSSKDTNYFLEESPLLGPPQWSPAVGNSSAIDTLFTMKLGMSGPSRFYRLNRNTH
jgi:hypothetical protein